MRMTAKQFNLRIDEQTRMALALVARHCDRSQAGVIRWLIRREADHLRRGNGGGEATQAAGDASGGLEPAKPGQSAP
jgi:hypothetical protein